MADADRVRPSERKPNKYCKSRCGYWIWIRGGFQPRLQENGWRVALRPSPPGGLVAIGRPRRTRTEQCVKTSRPVRDIASQPIDRQLVSARAATAAVECPLWVESSHSEFSSRSGRAKRDLPRRRAGAISRQPLISS